MHHQLRGTGLELIQEREQAALKIRSAQQVETAKVVGAVEIPIASAAVRREA
jgi:hypothetical protein